MMLNGPFGYAPHFQRFLDLLAGGATPPEAWRECFWAVPLAQLERDFTRYVTRTEMDPHAITVAVPKAKKPERERAHGRRRACTSCWRASGRGTRARASWRRAPSWPRRARVAGANVVGRAALLERRLRDALAPLRRGRARAARGGGARAGARAQLAGAVARWRSSATTRRRDAHARGELDDAVAHLVPLATSAHALDFLARYYSGRGQLDAGLPLRAARGGHRARLLGVRGDAVDAAESARARRRAEAARPSDDRASIDEAASHRFVNLLSSLACERS